MIKLTKNAGDKVKQIIEEKDKKPMGIQAGVKGGGCSGFSYYLDFVYEEKDDVWFLVDGEGRSGESDQESCKEKRGFHVGSGLKQRMGESKEANKGPLYEKFSSMDGYSGS